MSTPETGQAPVSQHRGPQNSNPIPEGNTLDFTLPLVCVEYDPDPRTVSFDCPWGCRKRHTHGADGVPGVRGSHCRQPKAPGSYRVEVCG